jgi:hypothetical protein
MRGLSSLANGAGLSLSMENKIEESAKLRMSQENKNRSDSYNPVP